MPDAALPVDRFELIHQIGGIRTATFDYPDAGGAPGCRVAMIDTGSGLRFVVALDRGGDVVEAHYNDTNLAYLTPNGYKPPSHAYHHGTGWLNSWPGGLVTTCGPRHIGGPRAEDGVTTAMHGHHSNTPAAITAIRQPDQYTNRRDMQLELLVRDSRAFGPIYEIRRTYHACLGEPAFTIHDEVTNRGNVSAAHNWLYHVNPGYPLLDAGCRLVYGGPARRFAIPSADDDTLNALKTIPQPTPAHRGGGENCILAEVPADEAGQVHVGLVNKARGVGLELVYPKAQLPRFCNWQHFGPAGAYVTGLEPYAGSLIGKADDDHPLADQKLEPGETRRYELTVRVLHQPEAISTLIERDCPVEAATTAV